MCIMNICDCLSIAGVLGRGDAGHGGMLKPHPVVKNACPQSNWAMYANCTGYGCSLVLCFASVKDTTMER